MSDLDIERLDLVELSSIPAEQGKKLRTRWLVDPEQDKKYMDRLRHEESLPDDGICPWTGEPHGFVR